MFLQVLKEQKDGILLPLPFAEEIFPPHLKNIYKHKVSQAIDFKSI